MTASGVATMLGMAHRTCGHYKQARESKKKDKSCKRGVPLLQKRKRLAS